MRRIGLAALAVLSALWSAAWGAAAAQAGPAPADRAAIREVITAQIEAFRRNDAAAAFKLAAPNIRARFGDAPHFLEMVRRAYPPVFRPRSFRFGAVTEQAAGPGGPSGQPSGNMLVQKVELVGPDGSPALALYTVEQEPDRSWRIAACSLVKGASLEI